MMLLIKKILFIFLIFNLFTCFLYAQKKQNRYIVVIDPGHGGTDPGKPKGKANLMHEKDLNLEISFKIGKYIEQNLPNVDVYYTRSTDKFVSLQDRVELANTKKADLLISVHCNSNKNSAINGVEAHIYNLSMPASKKIANLCVEELQKGAKRKSRGVIDAKMRGRNLYVTQYTNMPSVLIEFGYMSNQNEEKYLNNDENQNILASAIYRAVKKYFQNIIPSENRAKYYRVQLLATNKLLSNEAKVFEDLEIKVDIYENNENAKAKYKYMVGREYDLERAEALAKKVAQLGFKNAFVVKIEDE
ncbi:MAG: N-acetylmuramoyl-L-alanine amidase [Cytophagales bacterium]|nr:MAG: N-acetylmuramoyl-L-alanine amidase [Cytophagales bacterium]